MELKYKPSDELSEFELESLGVGTELKSNKKTTSTVVSKSSLKEQKKSIQKQKQIELQQKLKNEREQERIAFAKRYGDKYDFKPPAPKPKVQKPVRQNFIRTEIVPLTEVSDERILIGSEEVKKISRVIANTMDEFEIQKHPMVPTPVDRTKVLNTGRTIIDNETIIVKKEQTISKTAAKKSRSKLSKANFAYDVQGNKTNMNTQNMEQKESTTPVLEMENSFFRKPSESDFEDDLRDRKSFKDSSLEAGDFFKSSADDEEKPEVSKRRSKKIAKKQKSKMEVKTEVEQPIEVPVLEQQIEEPVEQSTQTLSEEIKEVRVEQTQTDLIGTDDEEIQDLRQIIVLQNSRILELEELMQRAIQRIEALEQKNVKEEKPVVTKTVIQVATPKKAVKEQPSTSSSQNVVNSPNFKPADPVRATAFRRTKSFIDDGNNLKVNFNKAKSPKEKFEVAKNHLTKSQDDLHKAVDQEVRDVSSERVVKPFAERLQEGLEKSVQKFKVPKPEIVKIAKDPSKPNGLPAKVWEKIKTSIPETEPDFQKKRDEMIAKKFKITFHARRQILVNKWEKLDTKEPNPYLQYPAVVWKSIQVITENDKGIFDNIEKWADKASSYTVRGIDATWAKQDA
jgi:hypothetical protein